MNALVIIFCLLQGLTTAPQAGKEWLKDLGIYDDCEFILRYAQTESPSSEEVATDLSNYQQQLEEEEVGMDRKCSEYRIHVILKQDNIHNGFWEEVATNLPKKCRSHFQIYEFTATEGGNRFIYERHLFDWTKERVRSERNIRF